MIIELSYYGTTGTKTIVKCDDEDDFDPEKGLAMAIAKHYLGTNDSKSNYYNVFKKWLPEEETINNYDGFAKIVAVMSLLKQEESSKDETDGD